MGVVGASCVVVVNTGDESNALGFLEKHIGAKLSGADDDGAAGVAKPLDLKLPKAFQPRPNAGYGHKAHKCRVSGRAGGMGLIRKYGILMKRQDFRERAL